MAVQSLGTGNYGDACPWQIDWDSVARNIAITVAGVAGAFFVELDLQAGTFVADCLHGPPTSTPDATGTFLLGNIMGLGRSVIVGPGSLIGHTAPVNSIDWKANILAAGTRWAP